MYDYKQPRREAITTWENQHPQDTFLSYKNTSFAAKASDPVPVSAPSTAPRGGYAHRGAGRGRGGRGSSHSSRPHSHSHSDSPSFISTNQFAALSDPIETPAEVSDNISKKRTLSSESVESTTVKPPKLKINRNNPIVPPLNSFRAELQQNDTTYFYGHASTFSNFNTEHEVIAVHAPKQFVSVAGVTKNNLLYMNCIEKLYQFRKGFYFKDMKTCQAIYTTDMPGLMKREGKSFDAFKDEWHEVAVDVMCECQFRKYYGTRIQHKLTKGTTNYVELTRFDRFWGSGSDFIGDGEGENWMGKILNYLRLYILDQLPESHRFKAKFDDIKKNISNKNHEFFELQKL
jgi:ribA/ribD-fused uncharacterized protein